MYFVSGSSPKSYLKLLQFYSLIFNLGMHMILIHTIFWKFAYPQFTGYADFAGFPSKSFLSIASHYWLEYIHLSRDITSVAGGQVFSDSNIIMYRYQPASFATSFSCHQLQYAKYPTLYCKPGLFWMPCFGLPYGL